MHLPILLDPLEFATFLLPKNLDSEPTKTTKDLKTERFALGIIFESICPESSLILRPNLKRL